MLRSARPALHNALRTTLVALACMWAGGAAHAAPQGLGRQDGHDVMAQLLADRGLLDKNVFDSPAKVVDSAATIGRQVREGTSGLVASAMNFLGVPYKRGGNDSDTGFDCSGFTRHVYESTLGLLLPRKVDEQAKTTGFAQVKRNDLKPGDLVFFNTLRRTFSHVGIYVGDGKFIHAPRTGGEVRVESMGVKYWARRYTGARRAPQVAEAPAAPTTAHTTAIPAATSPATTSVVNTVPAEVSASPWPDDSLAP